MRIPAQVFHTPDGQSASNPRIFADMWPKDQLAIKFIRQNLLQQLKSIRL